MTAIVKLTANFERNLASVERFLLDAQAPFAFDALIGQLLDTVIPNLELFPLIGPDLLATRAGSAEVLRLQKSLYQQAGNASIRQYAMPDYVVLYSVSNDTVHLLSIKHHRQLSFDLEAVWQTPS